MTDHKPPFLVRMADPSRTFHDPATGLYIAQDKTVKVTILSPAVRMALGAGGLIVVGEETQEAPVVPPPTIELEGTTLPKAETEVETSTQETTEEGETTSEGTEDSEDTTEEQTDTTNEEEQEEEAPAGEMSLKDIVALKKKKR